MMVTKLTEHSIPYHFQPKQIDKSTVRNDLNSHKFRRGVIIAIKKIINKMILLHILKIWHCHHILLA